MKSRCLIFAAALTGGLFLPAHAEETLKLSAAFQQAPQGCGDSHSASELYAVISRLDPKLQRQVSLVGERGKRLMGGSMSMGRVRWALRNLAERESKSRANPLTEEELGSLASLREARQAHKENRPRKSFDRKLRQKLRMLESRVPLSAAESEKLRIGQEIVNEWSDLRRQLLMITSPRKAASLRVYPNDELHVVIWEDDFFADDRCFSTVITLDQATLDRGLVDIAEMAVIEGRAVRRVLMILRIGRSG